MQRLAGDKNELEDLEEWTIDEDDSEISGDCNESQPCRGDEPWLDREIDLRGFCNFMRNLSTATTTNHQSRLCAPWYGVDLESP
jgi:hypothetical protein